MILLFFLVGLIILLTILASFDTQSFGIFSQDRVGKNGKIFKIHKIKTMRVVSSPTAKTTIISRFGKFLRSYKLDELPQLFNILKGEMSFVGPRPDIIGYADRLIGSDSVILSFKPGITGPAQIKYRNEEYILSKVDNPKEYNDEIIWKDKVKINVNYINNWSFLKDIHYIFITLFR